MDKKAKIGKIFGWAIFIMAVVILILMYKNNMDFKATVSQILGWFGK